MMRDQIVSALNDAIKLRNRLEKMLEQYDTDHSIKADEPLKKKNGRLSMTGGEKVREMINEGKSDSEIAKIFDIKPSAVHARRKKMGS